ncbi:MAG: sugar ABC transporter permease [Roseburia sp.]|nr:sugar ABC transporter permease [Roseburia sp.]MCM1097131.1 sugar ABC transporter permease [Ruminococcus flavefaciens]
MKKASEFFRRLGKEIKEIGITFKEGDWKTRVSYLIMGFGPLMRKYYARGVGFLAVEIVYLWYMISFGAGYLAKFSTLGTVETHMDPATFVTVYGDNSFLILLWSLLSIIFTFFFLLLWCKNIQENRREEQSLREGKAVPSVKEDLYQLLDSKFHVTMLALPTLGIFIFMILPILFMIFVAFTNYDYSHQAPAKLFTWVGLQNFKNLLSFGTAGFGGTFFRVLGWTLVWAFFATFLNYFLGMGVAILINKKGIKFKKLWRTILVMTIAIPQFVSLLYVSKMFANDGLINSYLMKWGIISDYIPFWTNPTLARITIIVINCWVGIPYLMLIVTGILMNIPEDLYESARIDGANGWQMFRKITLPYMLFVTGPYLLTQFTGNINNFNIIYLLSGGGPQSMSLTGSAGSTDLLVTWLYKMTINETNYAMAAVIGIMVFVVMAVTSLVAYGLLPSVKDEEGFQ